MSYRTGNHWGVTIVREGCDTQPGVTWGDRNRSATPQPVGMRPRMPEGGVMAHQPTARETAIYDQAHAAVSAALDDAIAVYREALPEDGPGIALVGLAAYHAQHVDPETVASMLAVAVSRLAKEDA